MVSLTHEAQAPRFRRRLEVAIDRQRSPPVTIRPATTRPMSSGDAQSAAMRSANLPQSLTAALTLSPSDVWLIADPRVPAERSLAARASDVEAKLARGVYCTASSYS